MKSDICKLLIAALLTLACLRADAQTVTVPARLNASWTLPSTATDGTPLTGALALTETQLFISTEPIAYTSVMQPTLTLAPTATTTTYTKTAPNGATLYMRVKACNAGGCSAFSNQATKLISVPVPGAAAGVTFTFTIEVPAAPLRTQSSSVRY